jgi:alpha(1,3/1,4) fucosyltransferase
MTYLKKAIISYIGAQNNDIFNPLNNKDGLKDKWIALKNKFLSAGIELVTPDMLSNHDPLFILYIDYPAENLNRKIPAYLIQCETEQVHPLNKLITSHNFFKKCFSWNDEIVDESNIIKHCFGNRIKIPKLNGFKSRSIFCSMIAANKSLPKASPYDLYLERQKSIFWFEKHAIEEFNLYGMGWHLPARKPSFFNKSYNYALNKMIAKQTSLFFPSWKGVVGSKSEVLSVCKFTIAYENLSNLSGYITEKIFDAFSSGCVPVYWGASNITKYIPANCFIDRREFSSHEELYKFMKSINENEFLEYQKNITSFLLSEKSSLFKPDSFANIIYDGIIPDFE